MRCPKCGYNSFDHLDSCKKCGKDLTEHKQKFGIVSVLFPGQTAPEEPMAMEEEEVAAAAAPASAVAESAAAEGQSAVEAAADDGFGFDFMGDSETEEDMSFDELFEEAPADEDVEETLPSPEAEQAAAEEAAGEDFDFDFADDSGEDKEPGFDDLFEEAPVDEDIEESLPSPEEKAAAEKAAEKEVGKEAAKDFDFDFADDSGEEKEPAFDDLFEETPVGEDVEESLPAPDKEQDLEDDFGFDPNDVEDTGEKEDPKSPFELPESSEQGAPEFYLDDDSAAEPHLETYPAATGVAAAKDYQSEVVEAGASTTLEALEEEPDTPRVPAIGSQLAALCCDLLVLMLLGGCFVVAAEAAISPSGGGLLPSLETLIDLSVPYFLVLFSLAFCYYTLFRFLAGQTPGEMLLGLRVETLNGEPLLLSQAFLRTVGGLLQLLPAGLGYLLMLVNAERRGWNDRLAGTRLISLRG